MPAAGCQAVRTTLSHIFWQLVRLFYSRTFFVRTFFVRTFFVAPEGSWNLRATCRFLSLSTWKCSIKPIDMTMTSPNKKNLPTFEPKNEGRDAIQRIKSTVRFVKNTPTDLVDKFEFDWLHFFIGHPKHLHPGSNRCLVALTLTLGDLEMTSCIARLSDLLPCLTNGALHQLLMALPVPNDRLSRFSLVKNSSKQAKWDIVFSFDGA